MTDRSKGDRPRRVTSTDVARESNVSRATVSYVLNNTPGHRISEPTRKLVLETARRLGHIPYAPARSLRHGETNIVLALVRDYAIGFISNRALRRLDAALAQHGYIVLAHRYDDTLRSLDELWGLVSPTVVVSMGGMSLPDIALIESTAVKFFQIHGIVPHERAGRMQAEYLYERGHRHLAYAYPSSPSLQLVANERFEGARKACEDLGIPPPVVREVDTDSPGTIYDALDAWSIGTGPITAVCAHNDEIAMMIGSGAGARGLEVGKDLAIIGVDNIPMARFSLTTVAINVDLWVEAVARAVLDLIEGRPVRNVEGNFLRLIQRSSA